jgi:hypothetical protein
MIARKLLNIPLTAFYTRTHKQVLHEMDFLNRYSMIDVQFHWYLYFIWYINIASIENPQTRELQSMWNGFVGKSVDDDIDMQQIVYTNKP